MKGCQVTSINQSNVALPALTQIRRLDNNNSKLLTAKSCLILEKSNTNVTEIHPIHPNILLKLSLRCIKQDF